MKRLSLIIASYYEAIIAPNRFTRKEPRHPQERCGIAFPEETYLISAISMRHRNF